MIQTLRETNPAKVWLREKFEVSLRLVQGQLIVVRFDLASNEFKWDTDKVIAHIGPTFLAETTSIASTIAHVLNEKMEMEAMEILQQIKMSFLILDALSIRDYKTTCLLIDRLVNRLKPYDPRAYDVWRPWIGDVVDIVNAAMPPENDSDTAI